MLNLFHKILVHFNLIKKDMLSIRLHKYLSNVIGEMINHRQKAEHSFCIKLFQIIIFIQIGQAIILIYI